MDPSRQPPRGRARARGRARGDPPVDVDQSGAAGPSPASPSEGRVSPCTSRSGDKEAVYTHMFVDSRRLSDGSNGSNGNGSNGNGSNGNGNNGDTSSRGRGSPMDSRGGSPRGMSPRATKIAEAESMTALDYVMTRPSLDFVKKVTSATQPQVPVIANYYVFRTHPQWNMSLYTVKVKPEVDEERVLRKLVASNRERIGSYMLTGNMLFTTRTIPKEVEVFKASLKPKNDPSPEAEKTYTVTLDYNRPVLESEGLVIQFYNLVVRQMQRQLNYELLGRHYYDEKQKQTFPSWRLNLWPGFQNSIRQQESGVMLNVESVWKVLHSDSVLHVITDIRRQNPNRTEVACKEALVGTMVVTTYNIKAYKVSQVDFSSNPESTFQKKDGSHISYCDYFRERWDINIRDRKQPMLVIEPKLRDLRRGQTGPIYLVPELCYPCGLTEALRSNFKLMKDLARCLHMAPTERVATMVNFVKGAAANQEVMESLRTWGIKMTPQPVEIKARMLSPEDIIMAGGNKVRPDDKADWTMGLRGKQMLTSSMLKDWALVVTSRDSANVSQLISTMQRVGTPLGYSIASPTIIRVSDARNFPQGVTDAVNQFKGKLDMIMVILANNNADTYAAVKKRCSIDYGIPSQCFLAKNINAKGLMSIATKVVIQMNAKQGGEPWGVVNQLKNQNLMVLGYDVHHAGLGGGTSIGAMTATMTPTLGSYFSCVSKVEADRKEVATSISNLFEKCLNAYNKKNGVLPDRIMMYRDGVGEGQLKDVYELEIRAFKDRICAVYENKKQAPPKLAYIIVNKRISTRFFLKMGGDKYDNPKPGMIVDDVVTRPERYDFYLVSQTARQGCVSPTYYNVLLEELELGPDKLQRFTFKMCHMYFNWSGTVAVPATCQNAHKLALLVGTALKRPASSQLSYLLHFL